MSTTPESLGILPRKPFVIRVVDRATVRTIIDAEHDLLDRAGAAGFDIDVVHQGWAPYIDQLRGTLTPLDRSEFDRLFVEESLKYNTLDRAMRESEEAERRSAKLLAQTRMPSPARMFFAGVNLTILVGLAIFWVLR